MERTGCMRSRIAQIPSEVRVVGPTGLFRSECHRVATDTENAVFRPPSSIRDRWRIVAEAVARETLEAERSRD